MIEQWELQQEEATQQMARELAQHMQSWLPTMAAPDHSSQQRILDLETEIAKLKAAQGEEALRLRQARLVPCWRVR